MTERKSAGREVIHVDIHPSHFYLHYADGKGEKISRYNNARRYQELCETYRCHSRDEPDIRKTKTDW